MAKKTDLEDAVKYVLGISSLEFPKGEIHIKLTNDGFIDEESLRSHNFEREITDLDISLANLEGKGFPEYEINSEGYVVHKKKKLK